MSLKITDISKILGSDSYEVYLLGAFFKYLPGSLIEYLENLHNFAAWEFKLR